MKKYILLAAVALGVTACSVPADHFERVWNLNIKLAPNSILALNAVDAAAYDKAVSEVDGTLAEINKFKGYSETDSVYYYVKKQAEFSSRFLHAQKDNVLKGGETLNAVRQMYLDSSNAINNKVNAAAKAFMKEYDLNYNFEI